MDPLILILTTALYVLYYCYFQVIGEESQVQEQLVTWRDRARVGSQVSALMIMHFVTTLGFY